MSYTIEDAKKEFFNGERDKANEMFNSLIAANNTEAMILYAYLLTLDKTRVSDMKAFDLLYQAAMLKDKNAPSSFLILLKDQSITFETFKDDEQLQTQLLLKLLTDSANAYNTASISMLAHYYGEGVFAIPKDLNKSKELYQKISHLYNIEDNLKYFYVLCDLAQTEQDFAFAYEMLIETIKNSNNINYQLLIRSLFTNKDVFKSNATNPNTRRKLFTEIIESYKDITKDEYKCLYRLIGDTYFYNEASEENLFKAYDHYTKSKDLDVFKWDTIKEIEYLEPLLNIENGCTTSDIVKKMFKTYKTLNAPHSIKRHYIIQESGKIIDDLLFDVKDKIDQGTYTNLKNSLSKYLLDEMLDMEEQELRAESCEKYNRTLIFDSESIEIEQNYSDKLSILLSGTERMLRNLFFEPFIEYLEIESKTNSEIHSFYRQLKQKLKAEQNTKPTNFTIGTFGTLIGRNYDANGQRLIESHFLDWLKTINDIEEAELIEKMRYIAEEMSFIGNVIRNPVQHGVYAKKWTLTYSLNKIILNENALLKDIILVSENQKEQNISID